MKRGKRKRSEWPKVIKRGSFTAKLYRTQRTIGGREYVIFRLAYHPPGGGRKVRDFGSEEKAIAAANEASQAYALGRPDALSWSTRDRLEFDSAAQALEGTGHSLFGAVTGFLEHVNAKQLVPRTVAEVAAELVADRTAAGCSEEHVRDISKRLGPFAKAFSGQIGSVTAPLVRQYLTDLRGEKNQPLSGRSRDNARRMIISLFNFARQQKYVSRELAEEVAEIPAPKVDAVATGIFTPGEMKLLLEHADGTDQALLAVGGFAGLRTAELHRLDWRDVKLAEAVIIVGADKAKTASRRVVPIPGNLSQWLAPHVQPMGTASRHSHEHALAWAFMKIAKEAGVSWSRNALRHSFCSYRLALTKNPAQTAFEAGNSPGIIDRHYRALVTEAEAKAWFDIRPEVASNVIAMPAAG